MPNFALTQLVTLRKNVCVESGRNLQATPAVKKLFDPCTFRQVVLSVQALSILVCEQRNITVYVYSIRLTQLDKNSPFSPLKVKSVIRLNGFTHFLIK